MRLVVVSSNYPGPHNLYGDVFVATRLKSYKEHFDVVVRGFNKTLPENMSYNYEGIDVELCNTLEGFYESINLLAPELLVVHMVQSEIVDFLLSLHIPLIFFSHGYDVLSWKRRLMNYTSVGAIPYLWSYVKENTRQLRKYRQLVDAASERKNIYFVFVSEWLKAAAIADLGKPILNSYVIPNGIDTALFQFKQKHEDLRKKIVILRSFRQHNYANDISIKAISMLSQKSFFNDLNFSIYGEGYLFPRLTASLKKFGNVSLHHHFVENKLIPSIYHKHGIMLSPSRLDTHGVSTCEAMACGLVAITSPVGGIPEYHTDNVSGFQISSAAQMAEKLEFLYHRPTVFTQMSLEAYRQVIQTCALKDTVLKEINLIKSCVATS